MYLSHVWFIFNTFTSNKNAQPTPESKNPSILHKFSWSFVCICKTLKFPALISSTNLKGIKINHEQSHPIGLECTNGTLQNIALVAHIHNVIKVELHMLCLREKQKVDVWIILVSKS